MKIHPVGAKLFHADGQKGMRKLIAAFSNSVNAPKNQTVCNQLQPHFTAVFKGLPIFAMTPRYYQAFCGL
jgi:hypothetical protein